MGTQRAIHRSAKLLTLTLQRRDDIGIQPHVVEAVLNHVSGSKAGVAGTYNKAMYLKEKREAIEKYAEYVLTMVG